MNVLVVSYSLFIFLHGGMAACYSKLTLLHGGMTTANEVRTIGCTSPGFSCLSNIYYMYSHVQLVSAFMNV